MAEEKKDVETLEGQGAEEQKEQSQPEKKYTDEEVNNISVKNSKKAVAKLMNILYECKKSHRLTPASWATIAQAAVSHRWLHTQYTRFRFKCQAI